MCKLCDNPVEDTKNDVLCKQCQMWRESNYHLNFNEAQILRNLKSAYINGDSYFTIHLGSDGPDGT